MQISQKLSLLILAFIAFSADAQENEIENQNVFLNGVNQDTLQRTIFFIQR